MSSSSGDAPLWRIIYFLLYFTGRPSLFPLLAHTILLAIGGGGTAASSPRPPRCLNIAPWAKYAGRAQPQLLWPNTHAKIAFGIDRLEPILLNFSAVRVHSLQNVMIHVVRGQENCNCSAEQFISAKAIKIKSSVGLQQKGLN